MTIAIQGIGRLARQGKTLCQVEYELNLTDEQSFTLTDGLIKVIPATENDENSIFSLEPYEAYSLLLEEPLPDGQSRLSVRLEPYEGHRPDERYQVRVNE